VVLAVLACGWLFRLFHAGAEVSGAFRADRVKFGGHQNSTRFASVGVKATGPLQDQFGRLAGLAWHVPPVSPSCV